MHELSTPPLPPCSSTHPHLNNPVLGLQAFDAQRDGVKLNTELTRVLTRSTAFEAVMRVRATRGLRIVNFFGNYYIRGTDLLALPNCTPDSVFAVEFGYDEQLLTASVISIQVRSKGRDGGSGKGGGQKTRPTFFYAQHCCLNHPHPQPG